MAKFIRVTTFYEEHPELIRRELGEATRAGHQAMGELWRDHLALEHFEPRARLVFGYQQRGRRYRGFKKAMARLGKVEDGGESDLVFSGLSRRAVTRATVNATPNRTVITHFMPSYFGKRRSLRAPDTREEMLRISARQDKLLGEAGERGFIRRLARIRANKVTQS